jgi:hypothetical protein
MYYKIKALPLIVSILFILSSISLASSYMGENLNYELLNDFDLSQEELVKLGDDVFVLLTLVESGLNKEEINKVKSILLDKNFTVPKGEKRFVPISSQKKSQSEVTIQETGNGAYWLVDSKKGYHKATGWHKLTNFYIENESNTFQYMQNGTCP